MAFNCTDCGKSLTGSEAVFNVTRCDSCSAARLKRIPTEEELMREEVQAERAALQRIKDYLEAGHDLRDMSRSGWADWIDYLESKGYDLRTGRLVIQPPEAEPPLAIRPPVERPPQGQARTVQDDREIEPAEPLQDQLQVDSSPAHSEPLQATNWLGRIVGFFGYLLLAGLMVVGGLAVLTGGYWLSDRAYDAGLWPLGAILRVALLIMILGFGLSILVMLVMAVVALFRDEDEPTVGMYEAVPGSRQEAFLELEQRCRLGQPALLVNRGFGFVFTILVIPAAPAGCLMGFVHGALMLVTLGLYAILWTLVWLPLLGITLATSWLWWKAPILWPVWVLLELPFLLVGFVVVVLGPQDVGGEDKIAKLTLIESWPYTYFLAFQDRVPTDVGRGD